jgi:hypothetical protein
MDILYKIAARRAELANQADAAARLAQAEAAEKLRRETEERKEALSDLAAELSENGTQVTSNGANLSIAAESPLAPLDAADFRRSALQSLLNKEARQRFSPWENWAMIAPLAAGDRSPSCYSRFWTVANRHRRRASLPLYGAA